MWDLLRWECACQQGWILQQCSVSSFLLWCRTQRLLQWYDSFSASVSSSASSSSSTSSITCHVDTVVVPIFNRKIISTFDPRAAGAGMLIAMVLNNPLSLISYQKHGGLQRTLAVSQRYRRYFKMLFRTIQCLIKHCLFYTKLSLN